jgi:hypothetical protein
MPRTGRRSPWPRNLRRRHAAMNIDPYSRRSARTGSRSNSLPRALRDKLRQAQDLFRHRVPDGDLATIIEKAVDLLIEDVKKERFATGRKARPDSSQDGEKPSSRHIPDAVKRAVLNATVVAARSPTSDLEGARKPGELEFDHVDGFARTHTHELDRIRLLCRAHNQHAAEQIYGRAFMERVRARDSP